MPLKILITAGPTREAIDPVRYISNHSSGKMGYALAQSALEQGAEVVLIAGPTHLTPPKKAHVIYIESAVEMHNAVMASIKVQDIFIACAAVADYRVAEVASQKIKKTADELTLHLVKNPDIVQQVASLSDKPFVVGFAAETENLLTNAQEKLLRKNLDMIIANPVGSEQGFNVDHSSAILMTKDGVVKEFELQSKQVLADVLMVHILERYYAAKE